MTPPPRARRLLPVIPVAAAALALAPSAISAPVVPVAECVLPGAAGLTAYFGYDNPGDAVTVPVGPSNIVTPPPPDRGQPTTLLAGRQRGVFAAAIDPAVGTASWLLDADPAAAPRVGTARTTTPRCLPNLRLAMQGPPTLTGGELVTWTITLTNEGYPDIADAIEPSLGVPVSDITVDVPGWGRFDLDPEAVPADGLLRTGQALTYRWSGRFGTEICVDKTQETVEAVARIAGITQRDTADDTATATSRVVPCLTDLAVTKSASVAGAAPGDTVTWTVGVVNAGATGVRIADITVTDPRIPALAPVDPPADGWLQPGATLSYRGTMTAEACGVLENTASVAIAATFGAPDRNAVNDTVTASIPVDRGTCAPPAPAPVPVVPPPAPPSVPVLNCPATRLGLRIAAAGRAQAGARLPVTITVRNTGRAAARGGVLRYRIPSGASLAVAPSGVTLRGGVVRVPVGELTPGAARTLRLVLGLDRRQGGRVHRATATAGCALAAGAVRRTLVARQAQVEVPRVAG